MNTKFTKDPISKPNKRKEIIKNDINIKTKLKNFISTFFNYYIS